MPKLLPRIFGLILLAALLANLNLRQVYSPLLSASWPLCITAFVLTLPHVYIKSFRWRIVLLYQGVAYNAVPAGLAYFSGIFVGFLTPGRLGEFVRIFHLKHDLGVTGGYALSSIIADRCFDLYLLLTFGGLSLLLPEWPGRINFFLGFTAMLFAQAIPLSTFLRGRRDWTRRLPQHWRKRLKSLLQKQMLNDLMRGFNALSVSCIAASLGLTLVAYALFFSQCYLLAIAIDLPATFFQVSGAVAIGSLVTMLPLSISGIGTRDAAIITYLVSFNVRPEEAMSLSVLIFVVFYLGAGLMGAAAWWIKPIPFHGFSLL